MSDLQLSALDQLRAITGGEFNPCPRRSKYNTLWWHNEDFSRVNFRQAAGLMYEGGEMLFGGAVAGGKSAFLLMAACQYLDVEGYSALLLRRTWDELLMEGGLIPLSLQWLTNVKGARWRSADNRWETDEGATLQFGHMKEKDSFYRYQGTEFQFIGFDQLEMFTEEMYRFMFRSQRRRANIAVPVRMRASANPGGVSHDFIRDYFIEQPERDRIFIPSTIDDNPFIEQEQYRIKLQKMPAIYRHQLLHGDWSVAPDGAVFKREWFEIMPVLDVPYIKSCRFWDTAGRAARRSSQKEDYTVGTLIGRTREGMFHVRDVIRVRATPGSVASIIKQTALADGLETLVAIEQQPGAGGLAEAENYKRLMVGHWFITVPSTTSKRARAGPFAIAAQNGIVKMFQGRWNRDWLDELVMFPNDSVHDDQVDSASGAFNLLTIAKSKPLLSSVLISPVR